MKYLLRFLFFIFLFSGGCGAKSSFYIKNFSPQAGEVDVSVDTPVIIEFNKPVNIDEIVSKKNIETNLYNPEFTLSDNGKKLFIKEKRGSFNEYTEYRVKIYSGLSSKDGTKISKDYMIFFTTGGKPAEINVYIPDTYLNKDEADSFYAIINANEEGKVLFLLNDNPILYQTYQNRDENLVSNIPSLYMKEGENDLAIKFMDLQGLVTEKIIIFYVDTISPPSVTNIVVTNDGYLKFNDPQESLKNPEPLKYKLKITNASNSVASSSFSCNSSEGKIRQGYVYYDVFSNCDSFSGAFMQYINYGTLEVYDDYGNFSESNTFPLYFYKTYKIKYPSSYNVSDIVFCDLNSDGYDDLVVGLTSPVKKGKVEIYAGGISNGLGSPIPVTTSILTYSYGITSDRFGFALACGDMNNDGKKDLVISAPFYSNSRGRIYVFNGGDTFPVTYSQTLTGSEQGEEFGYSLFAGDADCNTTEDLIIGSPGYNSTSGKMTVYYSPLSNPSFVYTLHNSGTYFGREIAGLRDDECDEYYVSSTYSVNKEKFSLFKGTQIAGEYIATEKGRMVSPGYKVGGETQFLYTFISLSGEYQTFYQCGISSICPFNYPVKLPEGCEIIEPLPTFNSVYDARGNNVEDLILLCRDFRSSQTILSLLGEKNFYGFSGFVVAGLSQDKVVSATGNVDDSKTSEFALGVSSAVYFMRDKLQ